ncbi:MAG: hypothetical protein DWH91_04700 [Planctomycetota bacterium]|nr:MAG: hypothetical protein DWH91_04700 [Planctomycetota bacterium]
MSVKRSLVLTTVALLVVLFAYGFNISKRRDGYLSRLSRPASSIGGVAFYDYAVCFDGNEEGETGVKWEQVVEDLNGLAEVSIDVTVHISNFHLDDQSCSHIAKLSGVRYVALHGCVMSAQGRLILESIFSENQIIITNCTVT